MKWHSLIAFALFSSLLVGCTGSDKAPDSGTTGNGGTKPEEGKKLTIGVVFDSGGRGDKSFNDSAAAGAERAKAELGVNVEYVESHSPKDYETNIASMAEKCDLVFAVGISQGAALAKVAPDFKDKKFAIIDGDCKADNVRMLKFKEEEGSFLVGYVAGSLPSTKKIGFIGGMELPLIKKFEFGYFAGAKMANPAIELLPSKYTGSWDDQSKGTDMANTLFAGGADVVYAAAGRAGLGAIKAAKDKGKLFIGVDSDQDDLEKGVVLTSMIKRVDEALFSTTKDLKDGKFSAGETMYDLKSSGVGTSDFRNTKDKIPAEAMTKLEQVKADIIAGKIKVPATKEEFDAFKP